MGGAHDCTAPPRCPFGLPTVGYVAPFHSRAVCSESPKTACGVAFSPALLTSTIPFRLLGAPYADASRLQTLSKTRLLLSSKLLIERTRDFKHFGVNPAASPKAELFIDQRCHIIAIRRHQ